MLNLNIKIFSSTPSGSPRTTVSELSGMEQSQQRGGYNNNIPDLRERLGHNLVTFKERD